MMMMMTMKTLSCNVITDY